MMTNHKTKISSKNIDDCKLPLFNEDSKDEMGEPAVSNYKTAAAQSSTKRQETPLSKKINTAAGSAKKGAANNKKAKSSASNAALTQQNSGIESLPLSLGIYMQEARVKAEFSLRQVAMVTKLNIHYIEAIERDDYKNTPPLIYVRAYIKKLCSLYNVKSENAITLLNSFENSGKKISGTILQDLQETKQVNKQDEAKIKVLSKILTIAFSVILLLVLILFLFFWFSGNDSAAEGKTLTASEKNATVITMEKLIAPQSISLTELPVNSGK